MYREKGKTRNIENDTGEQIDKTKKKKKNKSKSTIILVLSLRIREFPGLFVLHGIFYLFFVEYLRRKVAVNHD